MVSSLILLAAAAASAVADPITVEPVCLDDAVPGYATFQSHNQKVVCNERGIFLAYLRTRNEAYTAQTWRLMRSEDDGETFSVVYEAVHATNPPVIETDGQNNIHLVRVDLVDNNAYYYRFLATNNYENPEVTTIPGGAAGKYTLMLDAPRNQLYFFSHNNSFHVLGLDGTLLQSFNLLTGGEHAVLQYPLLGLADDGELFAAWTTVKHNAYLYWDIHALRSTDAAQTWRDLAGKAVDLPVIADDTGPATRISGDDEFEVHTWLSSFAVKQEKLHFMYLAQTVPPRERYIRYDAETGARDVDIAPVFGGETLQIQALDGFFAHTADGPLFATGSHAGKVTCLRSGDNGATWHDHAQSEKAYNVYAFGGCRAVTRDGYILGTFTDQAGSNTSEERSSKLYFVRIPVAP
jgi:hypothetical protein